MNEAVTVQTDQGTLRSRTEWVANEYSYQYHGVDGRLHTQESISLELWYVPDSQRILTFKPSTVAGEDGNVLTEWRPVFDNAACAIVGADTTGGDVQHCYREPLTEAAEALMQGLEKAYVEYQKRQARIALRESRGALARQAQVEQIRAFASRVRKKEDAG